MKGPSPRIANHHKSNSKKGNDPWTSSLLSLSLEAKQIALKALEECTGLQTFGRKMLEAMLIAAISTKADEACGAEYGSRDPERQNSPNGADCAIDFTRKPYRTTEISTVETDGNKKLVFDKLYCAHKARSRFAPNR